MAYEVTATRKRPQSLTELIDQDFVVATLKSSIEQGRIAHAYIFSGPRGVGKTSAARILAKSLNCEQGPTHTPCGKCSTCLEITKGNALDVIEIDGASNTSVNDVREIKDEVLFAPNSCRYKVYIIDEVHMLSNSAFNALLKTIEEPPPYIVFIFATTEIHKVPATIRSRCQQFNFKLISITRIKETLGKVAEEMEIEAEERALFWIAKESTGSMRDAYTLFDQVVSFSDGHITLEKIREKLGIVGIDEMNEIVEFMARGESGPALEYTQEILTKGIGVEQFVIELVEYFRNILFLKHNIRKDHILGYPVETFSTAVVDAYDVPQLEMAIETLLALYRNLRYSVNPRFELELIISRLACLKDLVSQKEILGRIQELKNSLVSGKIRVSGDVHVTSEEEETGLAPLPGDSEEEEAVYSTVSPRIPENFMDEIILYLRKQSKMALASSMEKIEVWEVRDSDLVLKFDLKDKFSGQTIKREQKTIVEAVKTITSVPLVLKIEFINAEEVEEKREDNRIELLKEIFNGEIVKGENTNEPNGSL